MTTQASTKIKQKKERNFSFLTVMQNIGKSLVFPIATLPAAALFLRLGAFIGGYGSIDGTSAEQAWYWIGFILEKPGAAVFDNLPIIFGIGIAFGFAKENRGEVALVGAISYFALIGLAQSEGGLSTLFYKDVNLGNGAIDANGKFHSDLLYLNILSNDGNLLSTTWLMNFGVFGGILTGLVVAMLYNKFANIRLPKALGFFSGRRFVPIVSLGFFILVSIVMAAIWPWINILLIQFSLLIAHVPWVGSGLFAFANRLLIPFGLHLVLSTYFWFQMPTIVDGNQLMHFNDAKGAFEPVLGDINAFSYFVNGAEFSLGGQVFFFDKSMNDFVAHMGDTTPIEGLKETIRDAHIGIYQAGFFPTMMFGLPAIAIAMAIRSEDEYKKQVWAFMLAGSAVAFLTGITEPLEFSFMFISPIIYVVYAGLTALYSLSSTLLGISIGFGFSAGFIDLLLSVLSGGVGILSSNGNFAILEMFGLGMAAFAINFVIVYVLIGKLNLATPGRLGNTTGLTQDDDSNVVNANGNKPSDEKWTKMAEDTINFIGIDNIENIDNCITRVRLTVKNNSIYNDEDVKKIGYTGVIKVGKKAYQMIIGPESEIIANEMRRLISEGKFTKGERDEDKK